VRERGGRKKKLEKRKKGEGLDLFSTTNKKKTEKRSKKIQSDRAAKKKLPGRKREPLHPIIPPTTLSAKKTEKEKKKKKKKRGREWGSQFYSSHIYHF